MPTTRSLGLALLWCASAQAQVASEPVAIEDGAGSSLRVEFAPYLWAISMDGDARIAGNAAPVDAPFTDTLDNADTLIGLMAHLEIGADDWSLFFDPAFSVVGYEDVPTESGVADIEITSAWLEFGGAWRVADGEVDAPTGRRARVDLLGGLRLTTLDLDVTLEAGGGADDDKVWVEPFVGARARVDLAESWEFLLRADVGGFGLGSDFAWQALGVLGWRFDIFGAPSTLFAGYRALAQDYEDGGFEWDVVAHGPIIGIEFRF
jgi:hypothetical protein